MDDKNKENEQPAAPADTASSMPPVDSAEAKMGDSLDAEPGQPDSAEPAKPAAKPKKPFGVQAIISRMNIYLLLFILILVLAGGIVLVGIQRNQKIDAPVDIETKPLTQEEIDKLKGTDAAIGDPKQTLTVESNAIFSGKILVRDSIDVAGSVRSGGPLSAPSLTISGAGSFDQLQANTLNISANAAIQGQVTISQSLAVTGGATFGGPISAPQLAVTSLQLSGDMNVGRHIDAGGGTPGKLDGGALGSGGTSSVSGTDTAGTVTINTGNNTAPGCFASVRFVAAFNDTPHVVITPVGLAAATLNYFITRDSRGFSVCTASAAPANVNFSFDYIVID